MCHCCNGTRTSRPAKPSPNPDEAGPIMRRLMGLPVVAFCDTARDQTRVCSDSSSTAMQCLRQLRHLGGPTLTLLLSLQNEEDIEIPPPGHLKCDVTVCVCVRACVCLMASQVKDILVLAPLLL